MLRGGSGASHRGRRGQTPVLDHPRCPFCAEAFPARKVPEDDQTSSSLDQQSGWGSSKWLNFSEHQGIDSRLSNRLQPKASSTSAPLENIWKYYGRRTTRLKFAPRSALDGFHRRCRDASWKDSLVVHFFSPVQLSAMQKDAVCPLSRHESSFGQ